LPLPGEEATISCPHSYPLFYEPLGLDGGHKFLEVGLGSGYGTVLAKEIVGPDGLVVSIEIDPLTFEFARSNLENAGYSDIVLVKGDGGLGYPAMSPYDRICITAACIEIPPPLINQLATGGRLIAPLIEHGVQNLVLFEKSEKDNKEESHLYFIRRLMIKFNAKPAIDSVKSALVKWDSVRRERISMESSLLWFMER